MNSPTTPTSSTPNAEPLDITEYGMAKDGKPQSINRRCYFQLLVFTGCSDTKSVTEAVAASGFDAVVYNDVNDPRGVGLLFMNEDPAFFAKNVRALLNA